MTAILANCSRFVPRVVTRSNVLRAEVTRLPCSQGRTVVVYAECVPSTKVPLCRKYKADHYWTNQARHIRVSSALWEIREVVVPAFAESLSEGDVRWEKKVGDQVKEDDVLCEIETDKTSVPVPSPGSGVIKELFIKDGDTVKPGQKLCTIDIGATGGATAAPAAKDPQPAAAAPAATVLKPAPPRSPAAATSQPPSAPAPAPRPATMPIPPPTAQPPSPQAPTASMPVAAIKHAQSLEGAKVQLPPTDYAREIIRTRTEQRVKINRMRLRTAKRLKDSHNTTATITAINEVDMSRLIEFRKTHQESFTKKYGIKLGFMSSFVAASAYALKDQPVVNAVIDGTDIVYRDYVDISVAVATPKGLVVPVLRSIENKKFVEIEIALTALAEKVRKGKITVEDMDGGTFAISNGGVFDSLTATPFINLPQSAILGIHRIIDRPVTVKGEIVIRPMLHISLSYDYQLIDKCEAAMFLKKIKDALEDPRIILAGL